MEPRTPTSERLNTEDEDKVKSALKDIKANYS